jgi:hypothetical protein
MAKHPIHGYAPGRPFAEIFPVPVKRNRAPLNTDVGYDEGQIWIFEADNEAWILVSISAGLATWELITSGSSPSFASLAVTGAVTAGSVTANAGNIAASSAGSGLLLTPTVVTAGASPQVANGRVVVVTFSGVSIAAAATQTFVITNSAITGATTDIQYTMVGGTSGSALTIQSVTNSAGSSSIVVTNGTGATTSTANITFTGIVLN